MERTILLDATGESMTFLNAERHQPEADLELIVTLPAGSEGPPLHVHTRQTELFEAAQGKLGIRCAGSEIFLEPGESHLVEAGQAHSFFSPDRTDLKFNVRVSPALHFEYLLTEIFAACNRQQARDPAAFDACYILGQINGEYLLAGVPVVVQKTVFPFTAAVGKLIGRVKARSLAEFERS